MEEEGVAGWCCSAGVKTRTRTAARKHVGSPAGSYPYYTTRNQFHEIYPAGATAFCYSQIWLACEQQHALRSRRRVRANFEREPEEV